MTVELDHLQVIDWEACIKTVGQKESAEEMLKLLLLRLPDDVLKIKQLYFGQDYDDLWQHLHKLRGALCYISLPRLRRIVDKLESDLKNNIMDGLPYLFGRLDSEVKLLQKQASVKCETSRAYDRPTP